MHQQKYYIYKSKYLNLKAQKQSGGGKKIYHIHDNGGRPFQCVIEGEHTFHIHTQIIDEEKQKITYQKKPAITLHPNKIFIGKSPKNKMTEFSGGYGKEFDGNSILLEMKNNEYIEVGYTIWSFDAKDKIVEYYSPVGNNDVPYPYAVDKSGNIYIIPENVIIMHNPDVEERMKEYDNPIDYYYEYQHITQERGMIPPRKLKVDIGIDKWYSGSHLYNLTYDPFPEKNYDRLIKSDKKMFIQFTKGKKQELSKKGYVDIINKFGEIQSFVPLPQKKLIMDRDAGGSLLAYYMSVVNKK
jgi:hypothetical protein